jgi:hypothetical protein
MDQVTPKTLTQVRPVHDELQFQDAMCSPSISAGQAVSVLTLKIADFSQARLAPSMRVHGKKARQVFSAGTRHTQLQMDRDNYSKSIA